MLNIHYKCFSSGIVAEEKIFDILNPAAADRFGRVLILKGEYSQGVIRSFVPDNAGMRLARSYHCS